MSWFTENPMPFFILGLLAQVILGIILWQTGRGWILFVMIALAVVNVALLAVAFIVVTPREQIAVTLDDIGTALETNKADNVLVFIANDSGLLRADVTKALKHVVVTEARVAGELQVRFDEPPKDPAKPTATALFIARIRAKDTKDTSPYEQLAQRFRVNLRRDDGKWLVTGYEVNRGF